MADKKHLKILRQGSDTWNQWRSANSGLTPYLRKADLSGASLIAFDLREADLRDANLREADLSRAKLHGAALGGANLSGANLGEAYLGGADLAFSNLAAANLKRTIFRRATLIWADLHNADLSRADLLGANLSVGYLSGANLSKALIGHTIFGNVDLSEVHGLETVEHFFPSTIGVDTIYRSKGKIPLQFLRGAGVPDNFIDFMSSLTGTGFEFYSCFISYSSKDQEFANRLYADLQQEGVRCWFAPHHAQAGMKLDEQIDIAIKLHERLLLILSRESINSEWVKTEIAKARKREIKESRRVLFPIRLNISFKTLQNWEYFDADCGKDSAREIREYYIPDFTQWKDHDRYQEEFKKLIKDLKKATESVATAR